MEAIIIEHLWKTYQRGKSRRGDIRQSLTFWWNNLKSGHEYFNALEDINLNINEGDVVGIIGPNGAGKSTLLKILSRITYPSKGKVTINGSLSSLLEVGVGFHPELTGRDNIYLNGAIHGMSKKEIDRKFESIVEFSGLELFLDTPVKQYSSGMYVRLAFS
ncbi:MAG: ATP-binding cassette domain-containing protein, partial [Saprospiraceae bacterium]